VDVANIVLEYIKTLAWPTLLAGALIYYRKTIVRLFGRISQFDAAGVSAKFSKIANEAEELSHDDSNIKEKSVVNLNDASRIAPKKYTEARSIGEQYRSGKPVIIDLTQMVNEDAKRIVDFSAGLVFSTRGTMDKIANKVFILTPPTEVKAAKGASNVGPDASGN
jgi:FtsZ-interacting cell division protein YlmF